MYDADSTEPDPGDLTPLEWAAARGDLPEWARVTPPRRDHIARVAALMEEWAHALGLGASEALRWAAAAWLHDALRDADPAELRADLEGDDLDLPAPLLHGPATAARIAGSVDPRVETAVRFHSIGSPRLDRLGRALYLADFLEPGRTFAIEWRAELRSRMPADADDILVEVVDARIRNLLDRRRPIHPETAAFWSELVRRQV